MNYRLYRVKNRAGKTLPKWKAKFFRDSGTYFKAETLFTDKGRSRERAEELCRTWQREEAEKAAGIPQISTRPIRELIEEFILLRSPKGKDGRPWCAKHKEDTEVKLGFWVEKLALKTLLDLNLVGVEKTLVALPFSGATRNRYFCFLGTFINWCVRMRYLPYSPLQAFQRFNHEQIYQRAAFTLSEIRSLLDCTPPVRRVTYQMALLTGMRHGELSSLQVCDFDPGKGVVKLPAGAAKNRQEAWFYLPADFVADLVATLDGKGPQEPLLRMFRRGADALRQDMRRAGIAWKTPRGTLDFHSFRATFATLLNEYGEDIKVIQDLMRHANPLLTLNRYTKSNEERKRKTVDNLAKLMPGSAREGHSTGNTRGTRGDKSANA